MTCGGLALRGWLACTADGCDRAYLCGRRSVVCENWVLAKGGRSVEIGTARLRAERCMDVEPLMARLVRLPELERALRQIAGGAADPAGVAQAALADALPEETT